jgi:hypothetical protein
MIRVTVELIPYGDDHHPRRQVLGVATIANDGTGTLSRGNYNFVVRGKRGRFIADGWVGDFARKQLLVWDLLHAVLDGTFGRKPKRRKAR